MLFMSVGLFASASNGILEKKVNFVKLFTKLIQPKILYDAKFGQWNVVYSGGCLGTMTQVVGPFNSWTAANEYLMNHPWNNANCPANSL